MTQKIIKVGNSAAVTLPRAFLAEIGASVGSNVQVHLKPETNRIILQIETNEGREKTVVNEEVYSVAKNLLKRYLPAFKELAKK